MGRAPCCDKERVKRGPWAPEEDEQLRSYVRAHGIGGNWIAFPQKAGLNRCGKSCRLRWLNYLRPDIRHGGYTDHEDRVICSLYASIGSRWSIIANKLPGRTDNDVKNYWNTKLKKKYHAGHVSLGAFSAPSTPPTGAAQLGWTQRASSQPAAALSPSASASSSLDTSSSGGDMCFAGAADAMYQPPQPMQGLVHVAAPPPPPHSELAATAALLDEAFLADLGAYGDLLFGGMMQDDKAAVAGLELSGAACYFPNMAEMWAGEHANVFRPQQGLYNTFT